MTGRMGYLLPINLLEVLPGDTIQQATQAMVRMSPMLAPVMHPLHTIVHHWFVPNRLVWDNWEDFITGAVEPDAASPPNSSLNNLNIPKINLGTDGAVIGTLADYFGIPPAADPSTNPDFFVNALPFRAYQLIYDEFYRDQNLNEKINVPKSDQGQDMDSVMGQIRRISWGKDRFTTARPWEQIGEEVRIPVSGQGGSDIVTTQLATYLQQSDGTVDTNLSAVNLRAQTEASNGAPTNADVVHNVAGREFNLNQDIVPIFSSGTINDLRTAFAMQRYAEARAQFGSRYVEYLKYLGVRSSDARLQRPEYLGGSKDTIQFSEVLQTSDDGNDTNGFVGTLRGHGIGSLRSKRYRRFFEEHGYIISLLSVRPISVYPQGVDRHFLKTSRTDYYQKEFAHVGQQELDRSEIYALGGIPSAPVTFGYENRYEEYRSHMSRVSGTFRGADNFWHLGREFAAPPVLNSSFTDCEPSNRIFADTASYHFQLMIKHSIQARRMVSKTGGNKGL